MGKYSDIIKAHEQANLTAENEKIATEKRLAEEKEQFVRDFYGLINTEAAPALEEFKKDLEGA